MLALTFSNASSCVFMGLSKWRRAWRRHYTGIQVILYFAQVHPHAEVTRIALFPLVVIPDQMACNGDISNVSRGSSDTVSQSGNGIDADMGLHAEKSRLDQPLP
jgi:hypothetical protein